MLPPELKQAATDLLTAAAAYHAAYRKVLGGNAVVWVESESGALVVLTRGEHRDRLMANIAPLTGPLDFAPTG